MISEATTARYLEMIRHRLRPWWDHPQWDDIQGEAVLEVMLALYGLPETEREEAHGLVWVAARYGAIRFLRSPRHDFRRSNGDGFEIPARLELDALFASEREILTGVVPDFAPRLVNRLVAQEVWAQFWALTPEREQEAVRRFLEEGANGEWAQEESIDRSTLLRRIQRPLNRYRRAHGLAEREDNTRHKEPLPAGLLKVSAADAGLLSDWEWFRHAKTHAVYRPVPGTKGHGMVNLAWEILARRDGQGAGPQERYRHANGDGNDLTRENLVRITTAEAHRDAKRRYHENHRERDRESRRAWYARHQEEQAARQRALYARRKGAAGQGGACGPGGAS